MHSLEITLVFYRAETPRSLVFEETENEAILHSNMKRANLKASQDTL